MRVVFAAKVAELEQEAKKKVTVEGMDILIVRYQGAYYAVDNTCPHMGGSLYDGNLEDRYVACPKHGSVFDVVSGEVHQPGKILMFKVNPKPLRKFPVKVDGDNLMIEME